MQVFKKLINEWKHGRSQGIGSFIFWKVITHCGLSRRFIDEEEMNLIARVG